jgi:hypothetical protein
MSSGDGERAINILVSIRLERLPITSATDELTAHPAERTIQSR